MIKNSGTSLAPLMLTSALGLCGTANAAEDKFRFYTMLTVDAFSNISGGNDNDTSLFGLLDAGFDITLSDSLAAHFNAFLLGGENPSANTGDFNGLDNNAGIDGLRLYRAYLTHEIRDIDTVLYIGKLAVDDEFMLSDYSALFVNSGFGILPTVSGNAPIPNYPLSGLGIFIRKSWAGTGNLQAGLYDGNTRSEEENRHGLDNALGSGDGLAFFFEAALHTRFMDKPGTVKLGGFTHSAEFMEFKNSFPADGNYSLHAGLDQVLCNFDEMRQLGFFVRAGLSPQSDRNIVTFYTDTGLHWQGPITGRPMDEFGLAASYTAFSNDFVDTMQLAGEFHTDHEIVVEMTYRLALWEGLNVVPDIQYIINPATADSDALVVGMRLELRL